MANIDFVEMAYFERLFCMSDGYILSFSNRTFQEFIYSIIGIDIYQKYSKLSKAKILRAIIKDCDNVTVGKLLLELMRYMQSQQLINDENQSDFVKCAEIGNRLIGKVNVAIKTVNYTTKPITSIIDYDFWINELRKLTDFTDTPQSRGYEFEIFLKKLFEVAELKPRGSFKIVGEQIDDSFELYNEVYLLEAKWTNKKIDKGQLVIFNEKVSSKSGFTRGIYVSFSGYSDEALRTFSQGRIVKIILITVEELAIILTQKMDIKKFLWSKIRALAEEGDFNKSVYELQ